MTRILQIRRGTAAQNDNFVGLAGEITADTDATTMRVHDGATPGGAALARADMSNVSTADFAAAADAAGFGGGAGGAFDINSVPAMFWTDLFGQYGAGAGNLSRYAASPQLSVTNNSYIDYIMGDVPGFDAAKAAVDAVLACQTPDAGYAVGDIATTFGIGNSSGPRPITFSDSNGLHVRLLVGGESFWVRHKTTGITTPIANEKWKMVMRMFY